MAVTDVSTGHQHAVGSLLQCIDNKYRIDPVFIVNALQEGADGVLVAG